LAGVEENAAVDVRVCVQGGSAEWHEEGDIRGRDVDCRAADGSIAREGRGIRRIEVEMIMVAVWENLQKCKMQDALAAAYQPMSHDLPP
jgi:hypothetical protein